MARFAITGELDIGYYLVLNNMRDRAENRTEFGPYDSAEEALAFHDSQLAEAPWSDEGPCGIEPFFHNKRFRKSFKKGSELEWMNPLAENERHQPGMFGHGVFRVVENLNILSQVKIR